VVGSVGCAKRVCCALLGGRVPREGRYRTRSYMDGIANNLIIEGEGEGGRKGLVSHGDGQRVWVG